ncbi:hypothetical protein Tco_0626260 [Tanacetum coccineum]|uniref:Uncharacterized protein n=1 Tax=Tanacetum coccineum TaxID=301880 RepID=A0ABQ4WJB7_9ASTR
MAAKDWTKMTELLSSTNQQAPILCLHQALIICFDTYIVATKKLKGIDDNFQTWSSLIRPGKRFGPSLADLQDSPAEEAETGSNVLDDGSEDVNPFGRGNPRFHDDHYDNPLLTKETESEPIICDIGDEEEDYPFMSLRRKNDLLGKEDLVEKKTT